MYPTEILQSTLLWFVRAFVSSAICLAMGYLGLRSMALITTDIKEFESIAGKPLATSLLASGFLIYAGLVIYGSLVNPFFLSQSVTIGPYFNTQRILIIVLSFLVSIAFGWVFYQAFSRLSPFGVDLDDINRHADAVGVFLFSYEVFLGIIVFAALNIPLG